MKGGRPTLNYSYRGGQTDNPNASVIERAIQRMAASQRGAGSQVAPKGKFIKAAIGDVVCIENTSTATDDRPIVYLPAITDEMTGKSVYVTYAANSITAHYRLSAHDKVNNATVGMTSVSITAPTVTRQYFCAGPAYGWRSYSLG